MNFKAFLTSFSVVAGLLAGSAGAGVITVDFTGSGGLQAGASMNFSGVTATAGADALNGEYDIVSRIAQYNGGLGNTTNYKFDYQTTRCVRWFLIFCTERRTVTETSSVRDDSHEVDDWIEESGHGVREYLMLEFDQAVTLLGATFNYHEGNDTEVVVSGSDGTIYSGNGGALGEGDFLSNTSSVFWFYAGGDNNHNNDWKLASITFRTADVPAPAALVVFGVGLLGLALRRRA